MTQPPGTGPDGDARALSARRKAGLVMLLSALGTGGSAAVWAIFGFAAAALTYAATIAALYAIVVRIVAAPRAQPEREPHRGAGEPSSLWPGDAAGPTLDP